MFEKIKIVEVLSKQIDTSKFTINMPYYISRKDGTDGFIGTLQNITDKEMLFRIWVDSKPQTLHVSISDLENKFDISVDLPSQNQNKEIDHAKINRMLGLTPATNIEEVLNGPKDEYHTRPEGTYTRIIDYKFDGDYKPKTDENISYDMDKFFKHPSSDEVSIEKFIYKVTRIKTDSVDKVIYSIRLYDEKEFKELQEEGFSIHPMFFNTKTQQWMDRVTISEDVYDSGGELGAFLDRSFNIETVSGLQLLYLIEYGLNNTDVNFHGIIDFYGSLFQYVTNAIVDENNHLIINGEDTRIVPIDVDGFVKRFEYDIFYDWLFIPIGVSDKAELCESYFYAPVHEEKNQLLFGGATNRKRHNISGPFCWNMDVEVDQTIETCGARLLKSN